MRLLLISDEEDRYLWDFYRPGCLDGFDIILSAGDLKAEYLSFLVTLSNLPLLYVHGNHDVRYDQAPPEGCECIDDRLVTVKGLRILGLGGCMDYNGGKYQYTEKQMQRRIRRVTRQIRRAGADLFHQLPVLVCSADAVQASQTCKDRLHICGR